MGRCGIAYSWSSSPPMPIAICAISYRNSAWHRALSAISYGPVKWTAYGHRQLYFVGVSRAGSFSKAAAMLHVDNLPSAGRSLCSSANSMWGFSLATDEGWCPLLRVVSS